MDAKRIGEEPPKKFHVLIFRNIVRFAKIFFVKFADSEVAFWVLGSLGDVRRGAKKILCTSGYRCWGRFVGIPSKLNLGQRIGPFHLYL
ncbi:hypothetical protein CH371_00550 [Leptospira wolffii]|uniref:Uncharacterized protein n=1 Tax=Leptospira wolffii TaxID=409998 RepID=A0A2M9ZDX9_9LEPT|nr:hypothetical protein CH371_00550 [Leptospira wolffii]